jgi:DNA-binding MarR family transcriptional regulator
MARATDEQIASQADELIASWHALREQHARATGALERALEDRHQLGISEFEVLERLSEADDASCRMQSLHETVHLSQSALSRLVQRLEDDGYVQRAVCDFDRRGVFACVTDAGRKAQAEAHPTHVAVLAETL